MRLRLFVTAIWFLQFRKMTEERFALLDWAADGRSLFCGNVSDEDSSLLRVEFDGSSHLLWTEPGNHSIWAVPSRDGRLLALQGATESANVWTVENR